MGRDLSHPPFYANKLDLLVYLDDAGRAHPITTARDWQKRRRHILANMQLVMGPLPDRSKLCPLDLRVLEEAQEAGIVRRKITFEAEEGDPVPAYLLLPRGSAGKRPAVLCLHQTIGIGKGEPAGLGDNPNLRYALELAERGYVTLAPDYPNFGDYKLNVYKRGYLSATMKGIWNHMRAVDLLQSLPEVDGRRIGCIGHSLGGHNTVFVGAFDVRIRAMVSSCGFNSFLGYEGGNIIGWSHPGYMPRIASVYTARAERMPFDFPEIVAALAPRALFVNAPLRDAPFTVAGVRDCLRAARPVYRLFGAERRLVAVYPDTGHCFPPEIRRKAYAFLDRELRGASDR